MSLDGDVDYVISNTALSLNTWYHIILTWAGGASDDVKIYINGILDKTGTTNRANQATHTYNMKIGCNNGTTSFFKGKLDQLRIFSKALSASEVTQLYNEQVEKYTVDISSASLTTAPTLAYTIRPRVLVSTATADNKANVDDIVLDVDTSNSDTTSIVTNYMSVSDDERYRIKNATKIDTDTDTDITPSAVTETGDGGSPEKYKYDITIPTQSSTPTKAVIRPSNIDVLSIDTTNTSYDSANDIVEMKYDQVTKTFRSTQVKWQATRSGDENSKIQVDLCKT